MSEISRNSNEKQSQKNPAHEQMKEMLNNRRHKKLTKKLPKGQTTSQKDETNSEKVLVGKMEQHELY